jgi:hypothetical protein
MKKKIIFPWGGGGNHIRWLMYFDNTFAPDKSLEEKLKFVKDEIYSNERTHYNWIKIEQHHRPNFDYGIVATADHGDPNTDQEDLHTLFVKYNDYTMPWEHYFCLHPSLNWKHPSIFKKYMYEWYDGQLDRKGILPPHKKVILCDSLWNETLDKNLYCDIIDFWNLEDHYEYAAEIHKLWYKCNKRAYKDFYEYYTGDEFHNYLKSISLKSS